MPRTSRSRRAAVALALAVVPALALGGCGDDGENAATPSPSASPSASSTLSSSAAASQATPNPSAIRRTFDVELDATVSGGQTGRLTVAKDLGCAVVEQPTAATLVSATMAVSLPDGSKKTLVIGVAKAGPVTLSGEDSAMVLLGGDGLVTTSGPGGGGKADLREDGREGTFDARLVGTPAALEVKGSFRCS